MKRLILMVLLAVWCSAASALAEPVSKLPASQLTSLQGETLTDAQIAVEGKWLLFYLSGDEKADRQLLSLLQGLQDTAQGERVALVVAGAKPENLARLAARNDKLASFRWLGDSDRSFAKALRLKGSATIMGMNGAAIEWIIGGTGKDKKVLRSQFSDWLR